MDMIILLVTGIFSRILPHLPNATAIGASAILSGKRLSVKDGLIVTFASMLITDSIFGFHDVMWAVYGSFAISVVLGRTLGRKGVLGLGAAGVSSSVLFYVVTNTAVWMSPVSAYTKDSAGYVACMAAGIPFFRSMLIGDLIYLGGLSIIFHWTQKFSFGKVCSSWTKISARMGI